MVTTDEKTALQMAYVRNNSVHLFILPGLICSLVMNARAIPREVLQQMVQLLYPFLRNEYFLHWKEGEELAKAVDDMVAVLEARQLISRKGEDLIGAPLHTHEADMLEHLGQTVMPSLERYYLTIRLLVQYGSGMLSAEQLGELAHQTAQRLSLLYEFNSPEFFDKVVLKNFINQLFGTGLVTTDGAGALVFDSKLESLDDEANRILSPDISDAIQRVTRVRHIES